MRSEVVPVAGVDRERLFALYELYYEGADRKRFFDDLDEKDCVILLIDGEEIAGFSTQRVFDCGRVRVLLLRISAAVVAANEDGANGRQEQNRRDTQLKCRGTRFCCCAVLACTSDR